MDTQSVRDQNGETVRVLVVDDYEDNRAMYAEYLRYCGFEVEEADSGLTALDAAFAQTPSVIVMDLSMAGMDGWEATRRLKADERTRHVPVIALTGHALRHTDDEARASGCDAFLAKPCLPEDLEAKVRSVLQLPAVKN